MFKSFRSFTHTELFYYTGLFYLVAILLFVSRSYLYELLITDTNSHRAEVKKLEVALTSHVRKEYVFEALQATLDGLATPDRVEVTIQCYTALCDVSFTNPFIIINDHNHYSAEVKRVFEQNVAAIRRKDIH
ncbi:hypothetical protein AN394_03098 [Pseudoalteromonas sp. P1-26]|uniref:hypothetical protein n=1 Tax=Pseudoalteromonas sp. P1-26 TaxID=1723759 RepID=UPI0006E4ECF6|nr:hypothetical protein [Pseudoalteromonas sp. P1-26]KPZ68566.1 hypothetical protein AN394_03098 [Pseudoalteromonas sp. P1-26]